VPSALIFRGMDDERDTDNLLSLELSAAWIDEPQGGSARRMDAGRLVDPGLSKVVFDGLLGRVGRGPERPQHPGMIWMTGNPPAPSHWIAKLFGYDGTGHPANTDLERHLYCATRVDGERYMRPEYYRRLEREYGIGTPDARRYLQGEFVEAATEQPFRPEWFRYTGQDGAPDRPPLAELEIAVGFDPAISMKDGSAQSALVVAGQVRGEREVFVLDCESGRWSALDQTEHLLRQARRWGARTVLIEDVACQRALKDVLDREIRERGVRLAVQMVKPDADKLRRANAWAPLVESGAVLFGPGLNALIDAMLSVPMAPQMWDLVDAAVLVIRSFPVLPPPTSPIPTPERLASAARAPSYLRPMTARPIVPLSGRWRGRPGPARAISYVGRPTR
jgi:predicted phage terminase large subunit-like protein